MNSNLNSKILRGLTEATAGSNRNQSNFQKVKSIIESQLKAYSYQFTGPYYFDKPKFSKVGKRNRLVLESPFSYENFSLTITENADDPNILEFQIGDGLTISDTDFGTNRLQEIVGGYFNQMLKYSENLDMIAENEKRIARLEEESKNAERKNREIENMSVIDILYSMRGSGPRHKF